LIGFSAYETIAFFKGIETQVGEWLFSHLVWGDSRELPEADFLRMCETELADIPHVTDKSRWLQKVRHQVVPLFIETALQLLNLEPSTKVVGFSCSFFQTLPALALGKAIKDGWPHIKLVYGGPCFHDIMGRELLTVSPWIEAVSTGEADDIMVSLFQCLIAGDAPAGLPGILYRRDTGEIEGEHYRGSVSAEVLDSLPDPDFSDFFSDARSVGLAGEQSWMRRLILPFESSRGCWWGEKVHCRFCGLNGNCIGYRVRKADKVYRSLQSLSRSYPAKIFQAADNNLSPDYFKSLLPRLQTDPLDSELFYSVMPSLNRTQIKALADARIIYLQPGIESLSPRLLRLMKKGVSLIQNIFFLKCCREYGLVPYWNNLIRVPGERAEDYRDMEKLIPKILHLRPPYGGAPKIEIHRFSPYFTESDKWTNSMIPQAWYQALYPSDRVDISKVAYYFKADWKDILPETSYLGTIEKTREWVRIWRDESVLPQLRIQRENGRITIIDSHNKRSWRLNPLESRLYSEIADPVGLETISSRQNIATVSAMETILTSFVESGLAVNENDTYLALALAEKIDDPPPETRRTRFRRL
jgi:ribosomal peptide maturation radical SAM protein 1